MPAYKDEKNRGTWYAMFYYVDWTGIRKRKKKRGFKTRREALAFERDFLKEPAVNTEITFSQLYDIYLKDVSGKKRDSTIETKSSIIKLHVLPYFKDKKIAEISAADVRMWQNEIIKKDFSKTYMHSINSQLSSILNYAVKYYGLKSNPCTIAGSIGSKKARTMLYWTMDEYKQFISVVKEPGYHIAFNILYWGGLRKGELMALTPADISNGALNIRKTGGFKSKKYREHEAKTEKSMRTVTLPEFCYNELCEYVSKLYGITEHDRIFDFNSNSTLNSALKRYAQKAGVKEIRVHDLRHSHVSLCIEMGMNILEIKDRMGHENIETTLNTYAHLYPNKQNMLASALNEKWKELLEIK